MSAFIDKERGRFGVKPICRVHETPTSAYYARKARAPSRREVDDADLTERIRKMHESNYGVYGARKVWRGCAARVSMWAAADARRWPAGQRRGKRPRTTIPDPAAARPAGLVQRRFVADRPTNCGSPT